MITSSKLPSAPSICPPLGPSPSWGPWGSSRHTSQITLMWLLPAEDCVQASPKARMWLSLWVTPGVPMNVLWCLLLTAQTFWGKKSTCRWWTNLIRHSDLPGDQPLFQSKIQSWTSAQTELMWQKMKCWLFFFFLTKNGPEVQYLHNWLWLGAPVTGQLSVQHLETRKPLQKKSYNCLFACFQKRG